MLSIWARHDVIMLLHLSLKFVVFHHNRRWIRGLKALCWSVKKSILVALLSHKQFSWDKISNLHICAFIVCALNRQELAMPLFLQRLQAAHHSLLTKSICNQNNSRLKFFIKGIEMLHELWPLIFFPLLESTLNFTEREPQGKGLAQHHKWVRCIQWKAIKVIQDDKLHFFTKIWWDNSFKHIEFNQMQQIFIYLVCVAIKNVSRCSTETQSLTLKRKETTFLLTGRDVDQDQAQEDPPALL